MGSLTVPFPMKPRPLFLVLLTAVQSLLADGPKDNIPESVRPIPPPGIEISAEDRLELEKSAAALLEEITALRSLLKKSPQNLELLPDVEVYHKAVDWALRYNEFFKPQEIAVARDLLSRGFERARALREGQAPWLTQTGRVTRAYRSKIDGSIQPFGLEIPPGAFSGIPNRVDFWCHGRGETLSELAFLDQRHKTPGQFTPEGAIVVHLYGRYCCANKFAGEVDLFEALDRVQRDYRVDPNRLLVRGFSMGGAAAWQFAVHYPGKWCAAAPGAGFSETADFLKVFQGEVLQPTGYEKKLWHLYDATDYALNLFNCPTVAYSGELDRQKQAADQMETALAAEGIPLTHLIGPQTAHKYHPDSAREIAQRLDSIAARGRDPVPARILFTTWTLRYAECLWLKLEGLGQHWERARVEAHLDAPGQAVRLATRNVTALALDFAAGLCPLDPTRPVTVTIDGETLSCPPPRSDRSWTAHFRKQGSTWTQGSEPEVGLAKRPGLQGPIDDAFLDGFVMVRPTGPALHPATGQWVMSEMLRAQEHWRKQFRGDAPIKDDSALTDADIAASNLVLWGDPQSNQVLARIMAKLPVQWSAQEVRLGSRSFDAAHHVPVLIFPNPLNPKRYVVLNSSFTYREYDYLNNARQVPKLPDYAVLDLRKPVTSQAPGAVALAGFFGEHWELLPETK